MFRNIFRVIATIIFWIIIGLFSLTALASLIQREFSITILFLLLSVASYKIYKFIRLKLDQTKESVGGQKDSKSPDSVWPKSILPIGGNNKARKLLYNEENIILPEFAHLKTPSHIKKEVAKLVKDEDASTRVGTGISISFKVEGLDNTQFAKDSFRYKDQPGVETEFVPLHEYWTTFESLDKSQKKWYFYWREQALKGNYLNTDLSYIILFTYELINYTFNLNAAFNVSMMVRLYEAYKDRIPKVQNYLPKWTQDMLIELGETDLALGLEGSETNQQYGTYHKFYQVFKKHEDDISKISMHQWWLIIQGYSETKFFNANKKKVYVVFKRALRLFQEVNNNIGLNLEEGWFEEKECRDNRYLYSSAVVSRKVHSYDIVYKEKFPTQYLFNEITALFRLSENVARLQSGEKRQIKVEEQVLPEGFKKKLMEEVSEDKIGDIKEEGSLVLSRFRHVKKKDQEIKESSVIPEKKPEQQETDESNVPVLDVDEVERLRKEHNTFVSEIQGETRGTDRTPMPWSEENEDIEEFINELEEVEITFLQKFEDGRQSSADVSDDLREIGVSPGVFVGRLNEKADEYLGDVIVEQQGEYFVFNEDFDEVLGLIKKESA